MIREPLLYLILHRAQPTFAAEVSYALYFVGINRVINLVVRQATQPRSSTPIRVWASTLHEVSSNPSSSRQAPYAPRKGSLHSPSSCISSSAVPQGHDHPGV